MNSLFTRQLLIKAAQIAQREREVFSKQEIIQKINEIKYLSSQKKVPKLTLRKEIIHLENKLKSVLVLEKKLAQHKYHESIKIIFLKKEIKSLRTKLSLFEDQDFSKKINKISHLLNEQSAMKGVNDEVELCKMVLKENKIRKTIKLNPLIIGRVNSLQNRLNSLKQELKINLELENKSPEEIKKIQQKAELIQQKLVLFYEEHPEFLAGEMNKIEVKHHMMMTPVQKIVERVTSYKPLPLPPPPRIEED